MATHTPRLTTINTFADEHPRRRRLHLLAGSIVVIALYVGLVLFVRVALLGR